MLSGKRDIQTAAIYYGLDKNILNRKVDVIKKRIKYFTLQHKFFLAINEYVLKVSALKAAANHYGINKENLENEIKECVSWISLANNNKSEYQCMMSTSIIWIGQQF